MIPPSDHEVKSAGNDPLVPTFQKAEPPNIAPQATAEDALAAIVLSGVEHLRANENCVLARAHDEGIHQMRVAVRRLRSCLALYDEMLPPQQAAYLSGELRWLIGELGPARDWDVFLADTLASVMRGITGEKTLKDLRQAAEEKRDVAYQRAEAALRSQRYLGLVMLLGAWAEGRRWHDPGTEPAARPEAMGELAETVAHALLDKRYADVRHAGRRFAALGAEGRHKLRIQIKKLRYATEFFGCLYPRDALVAYLEDLKGLQDQLGVANDIEVARRLVKEIVQPLKGKPRAKLSYAAGLVVGWHSHVASDREKRLRLAWHRFIRRAPFWQGGGTAKAAETTPAPALRLATPAFTSSPPSRTARSATPRPPQVSERTRT
jgi:CHAD domain-containing protein